MSAAALLRALRDDGVEVALKGRDLSLKAPMGRVGPQTVLRLRSLKHEIVALLSGDTCLHCERRIDWTRPDGVVFADNTAAHLHCYQRTEVERLLAAGRRAVESPDALADPAEVGLAGAPQP
jgi:hypothetical protein